MPARRSAGLFELVKVSRRCAHVDARSTTQSSASRRAVRGLVDGVGHLAQLPLRRGSTVMQAHLRDAPAQEFLPAASATTVTVSLTPTLADAMWRAAGPVQRQGNHAGAVPTFASSFISSERVIISYSAQVCARPSAPFEAMPFNGQSSALASAILATDTTLTISSGDIAVHVHGVPATLQDAQRVLGNRQGYGRSRRSASSNVGHARLRVDCGIHRGCSVVERDAHRRR